MRARSIGILVVSVLLVMGLSGPAFGAASCTTYDAQNLPTSTFGGGEKIVVRGTGFAPNARVLISLQQGTRNFELTGANANDLGAFAATDAVIPKTVAQGDAAIRAIDARGSASCAVTLEAAAEEEGGLSGLFWIWGALLVLFAAVLTLLTYRRWKAERLKEAVESLGRHDRYDPAPEHVGAEHGVGAERREGMERAGAAAPSDPVPVAGRPQRAMPPSAPPPPRAPQPFGLRPSEPKGFDESMRTTAPYPPPDDDDFPIGAPRPFDDRFAVDRGATRRDRAPAAAEDDPWVTPGRRPERPRARLSPREDVSEPIAFDPGVGRVRHAGESASGEVGDREPRRAYDEAETRDARDRDDMPVFIDDDAPFQPPRGRSDDRWDHPTEPPASGGPRVEPRTAARPVPARPAIEVPAAQPSVPDALPAEPPVRERPPVARPTSQTAHGTAEQTPPAHPGAERSFAQALREFLDSEDGFQAPPETVHRGPDDSHRPPIDGPPLLERRFEPTVRLRPPDEPEDRLDDPPPRERPYRPRDDEPEPFAPPVGPGAPPAADAAEPFLPPGPVPRAPVEPDIAETEPARPDRADPEAWAEPAKPEPRAAPADRAPPYRPQSPSQRRADEPGAHRQAEPARPGPAEPYVPAPVPAPRVQPRRPGPASESSAPTGPHDPDDAWEPLRRTAAEAPPPPPAVPRGPARPPARPVHASRAEATLDEPPVLPVGWDEGKLGPPHRQSSEAIARLRREVRDWKR